MGWRAALSLPLELLGAAIERFLEEAACCVAALAFDDRAELGLAFRAVDAAQRHLVDAELACGFGEDGLDDRDALHATRRALRAARRRIGHDRNCALAHGLGLIEQRDDAGG